MLTELVITTWERDPLLLCAILLIVTLAIYLEILRLRLRSMHHPISLLDSIVRPKPAVDDASKSGCFRPLISIVVVVLILVAVTQLL